MNQSLRDELAAVVRGNEGQLGDVFRLLSKDPKLTNREIADAGAAANPGAVGNLRATIRAIFEEKIPGGPSIALRSRRTIDAIVDDNPELSETAKNYLLRVRTQLDRVANDPSAIQVEDEDLEKTSKTLEKIIDEIPGVYVYTLPSFFRTVKLTNPDRYWFKIGKTDRAAGVRIGEQMRVTGLPEDPLIARVYRHSTTKLEALEMEFHRLLESAGHPRSSGKHAGREWFTTNLEFLDAVANALGCEIEQGLQGNDGLES